MPLLRRLAALFAVGAFAVLGAGCSATSVLIGVAGVTTDTSMTWTIVKHVHGQLTEGDERPCVLLSSVQRALAVRCGAFVPGSLVAAEIGNAGFAECPLTIATRDPRLWPVLPELLEKGARLDACRGSPLAALARADACPDFAAASTRSRAALTSLAIDDPRAVSHDVMRILTCPSAHGVGLDSVVASWRAQGALKPGAVGFSPLGALHPDAFTSPIVALLEADGHGARDALRSQDGTLRPGFEEALRTARWAALEWWLARLPELARGVPPSQGNQLAWLPLARVLLPTFLERPESQKDVVGFLLARGADPRQTLPSDPSRTVAAYARVLKSPMVGLLEPAPAAPAAQRLAAAPAAPLGE